MIKKNSFNFVGEKKEIYTLLFLLTIASTFGFQGWRSVYNNFVIDAAGFRGLDTGIVQSIREIPGFLAFTFILLLPFIKEHKIAILSVALLSFGVFITGFFPSLYGVSITTLIMSIGFHYYETANQSLTLQYFDKKEVPLVFGKLKGLLSGINLLVGIVVIILSSFVKSFSYKDFFILFGILAFIFTLISAKKFFNIDTSKHKIKAQQKKMILKKAYWLFYVLTFFAGARRQIFVVFAVFLLTKHFHFTLAQVSVLFILNNIIGIFINPAIGKMINRFGEKKMMYMEYSSLFIIFLLYAFIDNKFFAGFLYVLDNAFFGFSISIRSYFQKIALKEDIAPSMAVGFSINHIAAIALPFIGGFVWMIDYKWPFIGAAIFCLFSLFFASRIDIKKQNISN